LPSRVQKAKNNCVARVLVAQASTYGFLYDAVQTPRAEPAAEKAPFLRHSERSEESLFDLSPGKEGFLGKKRASE
jgi:hypothetical protein